METLCKLCGGQHATGACTENSSSDGGKKVKPRINGYATEYGLYSKNVGERLAQNIEHTSMGVVADYFKAVADISRNKKDESFIEFRKSFDDMAKALSVEKPRKSDLEKALKMVENRYDLAKQRQNLHKEAGLIHKLDSEELRLFGDTARLDAMRHFLKRELEDQSDKYPGMSEKEIKEKQEKIKGITINGKKY